MSLELDHVFCFCDPQLPELPKIEEMGFSVYPTRTHQGQGTANRCVLFAENYLELIYLSSKEDSLKNPLKLYRRAEWKETGASPFGIALRGIIPDEHKNEFWEYKPPYSPNQTIYIHKFNEEHPEAPLLFVMPLPAGASMEAMRPGSWTQIDQSLTKYKTGTTKITKIEVSSPVDLPVVFQLPTVVRRADKSLGFTIHVDGKVSQVNLSKILSVR